MAASTSRSSGVIFAIGGAAIGAGLMQIVPLNTPAPSHPTVAAATAIEAGRYIVRISGCNDCHTPGYMQQGEKVPESQWLTGVNVGWRGPWGTTYGSNLRLLASQMDEKTWLAAVRRPGRPPMPWPTLHAMSDADLAAVHAYLRHLGPAGEPTPAYAPPNQEPATPYVSLVPQMPAK